MTDGGTDLGLEDLCDRWRHSLGFGRICVTDEDTDLGLEEFV